LGRNSAGGLDQPEDHLEAREAQHRALSIVHTGLAVTIDIGDPTNIHPKNKQEVRRRLALIARAVVDGEKIEYSGPLYRLATVEGGAIRVQFDRIRLGSERGGIEDLRSGGSR
jgi:sialate O-acetylesterase